MEVKAYEVDDYAGAENIEIVMLIVANSIYTPP
jgi:hypothetical protein